MKSFSDMLRRNLCFICSESNSDNGLKDMVSFVVGELEVPMERRGLVQRCRRRRITRRRRSMTRVRRRNMVGLVGRLAGVGFGSSREWSPPLGREGGGSGSKRGHQGLLFSPHQSSRLTTTPSHNHVIISVLRYRQILFPKIVFRFPITHKIKD